MSNNPGGMTPTIVLAVTADANRPIQDCRIAGKAALPETVTDDRDRRAVFRELLTREAPAERRLHPDRREWVVEQQRRKDALGDVAARHIAIAEIEGSGRGEGSTRLDVCVSAGDNAST